MPETEHYAEMTAEEIAAIKALVEDKVDELVDGPSTPDPRVLEILRSILRKLSGPLSSRSN